MANELQDAFKYATNKYQKIIKNDTYEEYISDNETLSINYTTL